MSKNKRAKQPKQPKTVERPVLDKIPRAVAPSPDERIVWRLGDIELTGPWHWNDVSAADLRAVHRFLSDMEKLTWAEAAKGPVPRLKLIPVDGVIRTAQKRLEATHRDDAELWSLHKTGRHRIWGLRRGRAFHILWWDPEHKVCPSLKKHT